MSQLNGYVDGSITIFVILLVLWIVMLGIFAKPPAGLQNFVSSSITYKSNILNRFCPKSKAGWFVIVVSVVLIIIAIILVIIGANQTKLANGIDRNSTTIINPTVSGFTGQVSTNSETIENFGSTVASTSTYVPIGYGPVLDKTKVKNWLNGSAGSSGLNLTSGQTAWPDGNGVSIPIPTEQFKALYGFIPPSFAYYPKGQTTNDYNGTNYTSGRQDCMKACSLTDCTAVQTEVPENCSQESSSGTNNSCGSNSAFSCTLFYDNIKDADDAYWTIGNFSTGNGLSSSPGCFESTGTSCLGKKYYENSSVPTSLPNTVSKPSQNTVTFCPSSVTQTNNAGYGNTGSVACSCTDSNSCNDSNCCIMRPLLTTEYVQNKYPYYSLPLNISKAKGVLSGDYSMVVPSINYSGANTLSCGITGSGSNQALVSCTGNAACASDSDTSNCWKIDPSSCSGNPFDKNSGASALTIYKNNYSSANPEGSNYDDLYSSCYYRQQLTVVQPVQFNCDPAVVTRGCWGSPGILYTDSLSNSNNFTACSDTSVVPTSQRCQSGVQSSLAGCTGFPYSCGTNNGTNTLWVKQ